MTLAASFGDEEAPRLMARRYKTLVASGLLVMGLAVAFAGCSDSPPPPSTAPKPAATEPEKPLTAAEKRAQEREFRDMGIREKREWRRQQREAGRAP